MGGQQRKGKGNHAAHENAVQAHPSLPFLRIALLSLLAQPVASLGTLLASSHFPRPFSLTYPPYLGFTWLPRDPAILSYTALHYLAPLLHHYHCHSCCYMQDLYSLEDFSMEASISRRLLLHSCRQSLSAPLPAFMLRISFLPSLCSVPSGSQSIHPTDYQSIVEPSLLCLPSFNPSYIHSPPLNFSCLLLRRPRPCPVSLSGLHNC